MPILTLYQDYSRSDIHDIFAPDTPFHSQRGSWGLQGIVSIPDRQGDFVFFVTYGQEQAGHVFDEGVTEDGVLTWQSQPRQHLDTPMIRQLIQHNELYNSIYLLLRTSGDRKYTYVGKLKYISHDSLRENPVRFQWQILDWDIPSNVLPRLELTLQPASNQPVSMVSNTLIPTPPPTPRFRTGNTTNTFQSVRISDHSERDARNRELGRAGELLVLQYERDELIAAGKPELAGHVRHVAEEEGDGAGYDILSYTAAGKAKYIEVKTTRGLPTTSFHLTSNEVAFSRTHSEYSYLYRVYGYDSSSNLGYFYSVQGDVSKSFDLTPTSYRANLGPTP
ncbi:MAG: DUF3427 domain-containing protein [Chloroflexi bacterium]|nr:DUF3427 domain-containing protein [Chloroflexota bacterium]